MTVWNVVDAVFWRDIEAEYVAFLERDDGVWDGVTFEDSAVFGEVEQSESGVISVIATD